MNDLLEYFVFEHRTVFSFVTGIYVYLIAWGLLGQDSGDDLGPDSLNQFAVSKEVINNA